MKAAQFHPFADEAAVLNVGHLMIENRLDRITVSGDVDLTMDRAGLAHARLLRQLLNDIVAALEAQDLPEHLPPPPVTRVPNPFG
ncbi:MAG: hypothetical protein V4508_01210 [Pseudomonadota bacterium]